MKNSSSGRCREGRTVSGGTAALIGMTTAVLIPSSRPAAAAESPMSRRYWADQPMIT